MGPLLKGKIDKIVIYDKVRLNDGSNYEYSYRQRWVLKLEWNKVLIKKVCILLVKISLKMKKWKKITVRVKKYLNLENLNHATGLFAYWIFNFTGQKLYDKLYLNITIFLRKQNFYFFCSTYCTYSYNLCSSHSSFRKIDLVWN